MHESCIFIYKIYFKMWFTVTEINIFGLNSLFLLWINLLLCWISPLVFIIWSTTMTVHMDTQLISHLNIVLHRWNHILVLKPFLLNNIDLHFKMTIILNLNYILQNMIQSNIYIKDYMQEISVEEIMCLNPYCV